MKVLQSVCQAKYGSQDEIVNKNIRSNDGETTSNLEATTETNETEQNIQAKSLQNQPTIEIRQREAHNVTNGNILPTIQNMAVLEQTGRYSFLTRTNLADHADNQPSDRTHAANKQDRGFHRFLPGPIGKTAAHETTPQSCNTAPAAFRQPAQPLFHPGEDGNILVDNDGSNENLDDSNNNSYKVSKQVEYIQK